MAGFSGPGWLVLMALDINLFWNQNFMKFYVGVTNDEWYYNLKNIKPDEVNFWRPSSTTQFKAIPIGAPFLFKLHSPNNFIVGGGFFFRHEILPVGLVWETFGEKNGFSNINGFIKILAKITHSPVYNSSLIGCTILTQPFFFEKDNWIEQPSNWANGIMVGKTYDTEANDQIGSYVWDRVRMLLEKYNSVGSEKDLIPMTEINPNDYNLYLTKMRIGQGAFRVWVTDEYHKKCAVSGEKTLPVLEAAHIKPYSSSGPNSIKNGILLRSDLHILFDKNYLTITNDYKLEVSKRIKDEFENGKDYYKYQGKPVILPSSPSSYPDPEFIEYHNNLFR